MQLLPNRLFPPVLFCLFVFFCESALCVFYKKGFSYPCALSRLLFISVFFFFISAECCAVFTVTSDLAHCVEEKLAVVSTAQACPH